MIPHSPILPLPSCRKEFAKSACPGIDQYPVICVALVSFAAVGNFRAQTALLEASIASSEHDILSRLQRLEDIILSPRTSAPQDSTELVEVAHALTNLRREASKQHTENDAEWLERECLDHSWLVSGATSLPPSEADWLEHSIHSDLISFDTCSVSQITNPVSFFYQSPADPCAQGEPTKCIWIPSLEESKILVEKYLCDITHIHHVIHSPTVRTMVNDMYTNLQSTPNTMAAKMALLLSIIASATYSWTSRDNDTIFPSPEVLNRQSLLWIKATLDVLDYSRRSTSGAIEEIQAMIILSFLVSSLEGLSRRYRDLFSTAAALARQLSLHRIDHPNPALRPFQDPDSLQAEVGRRVWWYVVATDCRYIGPHEGIYTVNPKHMAVNKPRNENDEDLLDGLKGDDKPLSQPTCMSYFLQRVKLAERSRDFTDRDSLRDVSLSSESQNNTMVIDAEIEQFIREIPTFFSLDHSSAADNDVPKAQRTPGILIQSYILNSLVHAQRCKLHVKYLAQAKTDPACARSREICLHAARTVVRTERLLRKESTPFVMVRFKYSGVLYCLFMAAVVLLLDVCLNKGVADEEARKAEAMTAFGILEEAREQSKMATKLLESLMSVVRKHHVTLPGLPKDGQTFTASSSDSPMIVEAGEPTSIEETGIPDTENLPELDLSYFDEIWQSLGTEMDVANLFSGLNSHFP
ncbi:MAG: hypothetical protein Q9191_004811 [Dirinaria sp. TL-2023a]